MVLFRASTIPLKCLCFICCRIPRGLSEKVFITSEQKSEETKEPEARGNMKRSRDAPGLSTETPSNGGIYC